MTKIHVTVLSAEIAPASLFSSQPLHSKIQAVHDISGHHYHYHYPYHYVPVYFVCGRNF